jgi:hypothetical protein
MPPQNERAKLIECIELRLKRKDYEALFTGGECFRFALRLHDRYKWKIRGIDVTGESPHVWAIDDHGRAIDIYGVHSECLKKALADEKNQKVASNAEIEVIRTKVENRCYPAHVAARLNKLADCSRERGRRRI